MSRLANGSMPTLISYCPPLHSYLPVSHSRRFRATAVSQIVESVSGFVSAGGGTRDGGQGETEKTELEGRWSGVSFENGDCFCQSLGDICANSNSWTCAAAAFSLRGVGPKCPMPCAPGEAVGCGSKSSRRGNRRAIHQEPDEYVSRR
jgi:hypothetical protein